MQFYNNRPESNLIVDKIIKWIVDIVTVIAIAMFAVAFLCEETEIIGSSMSPELEDGQSVLINKITYELSNPDRFDVIVYKSALGGDQYVVKRIIGLPGEKIRIEDSKIYINGELLEDKYYSGTFESGTAATEIIIGSNEYFVLGDNRNLSEDSRFDYIGTISIDDIIGEAWFISSPFNKMGFVE